MGLAMTIGMDDRICPGKALKNGLRRRCPHCAVGPVLDGWLTVRDRCPVCGLVYEPKAGDTWAFWIIGDRVPVAAAIGIVYFGFGPHSWLQGVFFFSALAFALVTTIPHRIGLVIALHYLTRRYWPDPDDPMRLVEASTRDPSGLQPHL
jgi:uncharacterized protein (DUF983 family)